MPERFDYYEKAPTPSLAELREGASLLVNRFGENYGRFSANGRPKLEKVVAANFDGEEVGDNARTIFTSICIDGTAQIESYLGFQYPFDDEIIYQREWVIDLCTSPTLDEIYIDEEKTTDYQRRQAAKWILASWNICVAQSQTSNL